MEERPLVRQLFEPESDPGPTPGERRGFGQVDWGWKRVLLVLALGSLFSAGMMPIGLYATAGGGRGAAAAFTGQVALTYGVLVGLVLIIGLRGQPNRRQALGFRAVDLRSLAGLLALVAGIIITANLAGNLLFDLPHPRNIFIFGRHAEAVFLTAFLVLILAPLAEEVFFRGFLLQALVPRVTFWPAAILSSAVFALAHGSLHLLPPIFILGLAFSWLFWRTGSLWAPIATHATINGSSLAVLLILG